MTNYIHEDIKRFRYLPTEIDIAYHEAVLKIGLSDGAMTISCTICNNGD